jgi:hypothetical protein
MALPGTRRLLAGLAKFERKPVAIYAPDLAGSFSDITDVPGSLSVCLSVCFNYSLILRS